MIEDGRVGRVGRMERWGRGYERGGEVREDGERERDFHHLELEFNTLKLGSYSPRSLDMFSIIQSFSMGSETIFFLNLLVFIMNLNSRIWKRISFHLL